MMETAEQQKLRKALDVAHEALLEACKFNELTAAEYMKRAASRLKGESNV